MLVLFLFCFGRFYITERRNRKKKELRASRRKDRKKKEHTQKKPLSSCCWGRDWDTQRFDLIIIIDPLFFSFVYFTYKFRFWFGPLFFHFDLLLQHFSCSIAHDDEVTTTTTTSFLLKKEISLSALLSPHDVLLVVVVVFCITKGNSLVSIGLQKCDAPKILVRKWSSRRR